MRGGEHGKELICEGAGEVTVQGGSGSLPPSVATMSTGQREGWRRHVVRAMVPPARQPSRLSRAIRNASLVMQTEPQT